MRSEPPSPVLFVHGLVGHMRDAQIERAIGEPVFAPNLLGYGERKGSDVLMSLPAQVEFLREFIDETTHGNAVHLVGHSIGGAIAVLFAHRYPQFVRSIVNVEGNFTLKDAFWSKVIAEMSGPEVERWLRSEKSDPSAWLQRAGAAPTTMRIVAARSHLANQDGPAVLAMAKSVVEITDAPKYLQEVQDVLDWGIPMHLVAGDRSRSSWDVPEFVESRAASESIIPDCGHLITIEQPKAFARIVRGLTRHT